MNERITMKQEEREFKRKLVCNSFILVPHISLWTEGTSFHCIHQSFAVVLTFLNMQIGAHLGTIYQFIHKKIYLYFVLIQIPNYLDCSIGGHTRPQACCFPLLS